MSKYKGTSIKYSSKKQQNDIVYVEPKYKTNDKEERAIQYGSLLLSLSAAVTSLFWILK